MTLRDYNKLTGLIAFVNYDDHYQGWPGHREVPTNPAFGGGLGTSIYGPGHV